MIGLGIGSYTFTWAAGVPGYEVVRPMGAAELVTRAHELGAEVVQFADNMPLDALPEGELRKIAAIAEEKGIAIEVGARGLTPNRLRAYIGLAQRFGSDILRFVIDGNGYEPTPGEVVAVIEPFVSELEEKNITLAIENHDRLTCAEFTAIVESCSSPNVGICLDTVNSLGVPEGTHEVISRLLPYTVNLHVKDFSISRPEHKMGFRVEGAPAGDGKLNIPALLSRLKALGRCRSAILELWTPFGPTMEETLQRESRWAARSMEYLKKIELS
jgi:sugar phosphate isomerase/epimerase